MEVDETQTQIQIQIQRQVSKFQRVLSPSNASTTTASNNADDVAAATARLCGWPSSRIVRVSRASGGKDRHSKVLTSKGLRDRRVRLSVGTAIQFYDLQDRLGLDQPSKAVEWLLKAAASSIDELPSLDPPFTISAAENTTTTNNNNNNNGNSQACSSTSETSKGSGLSLSRSENRNKARERAREMKSNKDKEKEKEIDSPRVRVFKNPVNNTLSENSSFTDLLTGRSPMDYFYPRSPQPSPQFNITSAGANNNNNNYHNHQFSFLQDSFGGDGYNLNFAMTSSSTGAAPGGFGRGTLQSNLQSSVMPHHQLQSDGSTPFYIVPNATVDHYPAPGGYHINYGRSDNHKEKSKN